MENGSFRRLTPSRAATERGRAPHLVIFDVRLEVFSRHFRAGCHYATFFTWACWTDFGIWSPNGDVVRWRPEKRTEGAQPEYRSDMRAHWYSLISLPPPRSS